MSWNLVRKQQQPAAVSWQSACSLHSECEAVSCFPINLCNPTSSLLTIFGIGRFFSLSEGETGPKRTAFQQH